MYVQTYDWNADPSYYFKYGSVTLLWTPAWYTPTHPLPNYLGISMLAISVQAPDRVSNLKTFLSFNSSQHLKRTMNIYNTFRQNPKILIYKILFKNLLSLPLDQLNAIAILQNGSPRDIEWTLMRHHSRAGHRHLEGRHFCACVKRKDLSWSPPYWVEAFLRMRGTKSNQLISAILSSGTSAHAWEINLNCLVTAILSGGALLRMRGKKKQNRSPCW